MDFYLAKGDAAALDISLPASCQVALVVAAKQGALNYSHLIATVDEGMNPVPLRRGRLNAQELERLNVENLGKTNALSKFATLGGFDSVKTDFSGKESCGGFSIYRYNVTIDDLDELKARLEGGGYIVGLN